MMKWIKCAIRFLRISRPGVRVPSIAPRKTSTRCVLVFLFVCTMEGARTRRRRTAPQAISPVGCCLACGSQWLGMSTVEAVDRKISWLFYFVSHECTVSARWVLSMSDYVGRCIALQSVPFFASGEQCQAQLCLHFRVGILEQFQKSRHGDGGFATDLLRDFLRRAQLLHHDLQSGAGLLPGCGPAGARAAGFSADTPGALPLQLRHRIGGRYPEPDHHPAGKGSRGGETIRDRSGAAGHRPGGRGRRNPYSRPSSSIRRTSCRLAHSVVYRRRISSSGWARSGTITVTKPPAAPARTPL